MTVFVWACKELGYKTLEMLIERGVSIRGVAVSKNDKWRNNIVKLTNHHEIPFYFAYPHDVKADRGLIIAWPHILKPDVVDAFDRGIVNIHFAPLPYYRGSGCLEQALLAGDKRFGVSLHFIDHGVDTGPIIEVWWGELGKISLDEATDKFVDLAFRMIKHFQNILFGSMADFVEVKSYDQKRMEKDIKVKVCTRQNTKQLLGGI